MRDRTSTSACQRRRTRRGVGVLVGVALMATPLAMAPASQAQLQLRASPDLIEQIIALIGQIIEGLGHTLQTPLGEKAPNSVNNPCEPALVSPALNCVISQIPAPGPKAKATLKKGKVKSVRWVKK